MKFQWDEFFLQDENEIIAYVVKDWLFPGSLGSSPLDYKVYISAFLDICWIKIK